MPDVVSVDLVRFSRFELTPRLGCQPVAASGPPPYGADFLGPLADQRRAGLRLNCRRPWSRPRLEGPVREGGNWELGDWELVIRTGDRGGGHPRRTRCCGTPD